MSGTHYNTGRKRHGTGVGGIRIRDTHGSGGNLMTPSVEGISWADSRTGEQIQQPDIAPGAVDGEVHIQPGTITQGLFAEAIRVPELVDQLPTLPDADYPVGALVVLVTDHKLYRNPDDVSWTAAVDGADIIANSIVSAKIAAGAIGTNELAATIILASLLKTAHSGTRIEIDTYGIRAIDDNEELQVSIPSDGSPVFVRADLIANSLVSESAQLRGATSLPSDAVLTAEAGIVAPLAAPSVFVHWPTLSYQSPTAGMGIVNWTIGGGDYDALAGADGLTPCYVAPVQNEDTNVWYMVEWDAATGLIDRTTVIDMTGYNGGIVTRLGAYWYMTLGQTGPGSMYLRKIDRSTGVTVSTVDITARFGQATEYGVPIKTDGTSLYCLGRKTAWGNPSNQHHVVRFDTSLAYVSTTDLTMPTVDAAYNFNYHSWEFAIADEGAGTRWFVGYDWTSSTLPRKHRIYQYATTGGAALSDSDFPSPNIGQFGNSLSFTGTNIQQINAAGYRMYTFTDWDWTTETPIYWFGYSWYDSQGTTHESSLGPLRSVTMDRRQQVGVTVASRPGSGGVDEPDMTRVYYKRSATAPAAGTLYLAGTLSTGNTVYLTDYTETGGNDGTGTPFPMATPGFLKSGVNNYGDWRFYGDGSAVLGRIRGSIDGPADDDGGLVINDEGLGGSTPHVRVGWAGVKGGPIYTGMRIDADGEIRWYNSSGVIQARLYHSATPGRLTLGLHNSEYDTLWSYHENVNNANGGWVIPALINSWSNYGSNWPSLAYRLDAQGWVHLRGLVHSNWATSDIMLNLPANFRPVGSGAYGTGHHFICASNGAAQVVRVLDNGNIDTARNANTALWLDLSSISFKAHN